MKLFKIFIWFSFGWMTALLFAQEKGETLRKKISKSKKPCLTAFEEYKKVDMAIWAHIQKKLKDFLN